MNGAESLIRTLIAGSLDVCFTNPGTSEMDLVAALDRVTQVRCILGLFEGVVTGAADGYARMAEKPACTLLHLGPGLANGLANLHNAKRAQVPMVNIVGQHALSHLHHDAPLTSDIEAIAKPFSSWVRTSRRTTDLGEDGAQAIVAARTEPGQISSLIVPADIAWSEGGRVASVPSPPRPPLPPNQKIERAAAMLRSGLPTCFLLAGRALYGKGLALAGRISSATGSQLLSPYPFTRMERGHGRPRVQRLQYVLEAAVEQLRPFRQLILVGAPPPVSYFGYPGKDSVLTSSACEVYALTASGEDSVGALEALAAALAIPSGEADTRSAEPPALPAGGITLPGLAATVAACLPENAIVVDESMTSGRGMMAATQGAPSHDWLANTGGAIGIALPLAVGAAVACPDRRVLCLSADGSAMYTAQALWTMAREGLNLTTVVFANRDYAVLKREFLGLGVGAPGPRALSLFEIGNPEIDWVLLAKAMGVPAKRVGSLDEFGKLLQAGLSDAGPALIEVPL